VDSRRGIAAQAFARATEHVSNTAACAACILRAGCALIWTLANHHARLNTTPRDAGTSGACTDRSFKKVRQLGGQRRPSMTSIQVFDLSLGGAAADQALADFATDVEWATKQGARIERFSFAEQPLAFAQNAVVEDFLERSGHDALPLILVNGEMALSGRHPTRSELARWAGLEQPTLKPIRAGDCCSGGNCG
jgi:hypothetical protein